ncbi:MAG: hypothetical protein ACOZNI_15065, partial [Myxococcota bacterium]
MILPTLALAAEPTGVVETVVQARPDMLGEAFVAGSAVAAGAADVRHVHLEGFGELGWPAGVPVPVVPRVFVLTADGRDDAVDWTVGRQRVDLPTWARTLDGARAAWSVRPDLRAEAWIGQARHLALEDFASGAPIARLAGTWTSPRWLAVAGLWGEGGPRGAVHPDLRLGWRDPDLRLSPDVSGLLALGFAGEGPVVERARVQATARPAAGVRAVVHGEHRGVLDPAAELGPDILAAFAPTGSDEAGVGVGGITGARDRHRKTPSDLEGGRSLCPSSFSSSRTCSTRRRQLEHADQRFQPSRLVAQAAGRGRPLLDHRP